MFRAICSKGVSYFLTSSLKRRNEFSALCLADKLALRSHGKGVAYARNIRSNLCVILFRCAVLMRRLIYLGAIRVGLSCWVGSKRGYVQPHRGRNVVRSKESNTAG